MNILDIIILLCSLPILIDGYKKGFVRQAISILALLIGVWIASGLGDNVGSWIHPALEGKCDRPHEMANMMGFAIMFGIVLASLGIIGRIVERLIMIVVPEWCNKVLGLSLALCNVLLTCCIFFLIFNLLENIYDFLPSDSSLFADSAIYPMIESLTNAILPNIHKILL